jgi:hypothetical protein
MELKREKPGGSAVKARCQTTRCRVKLEISSPRGHRAARLASQSSRPRREYIARVRNAVHGLYQLRYDLRKLKGHGLLEHGSRYAYRLTTKGVQVALLFLFFHKRLCGPLANSRFHHQPDPTNRPNSKLESAYHRADKAIQHIVDVMEAA